jgi:hypothetical protein
MSHPDDWMPWDGEPRFPELADDTEHAEIPGQIDIFEALDEHSHSWRYVDSRHVFVCTSCHEVDAA